MDPLYLAACEEVDLLCPGSIPIAPPRPKTDRQVLIGMGYFWDGLTCEYVAEDGRRIPGERVAAYGVSAFMGGEGA